MSKGFYMLAGTVLTHDPMQQVMGFLRDAGIACDIDNDGLSIRENATLHIRTGFDHELILVGDARERDDLTRLAARISAVLRERGLQHAYEIYDTCNKLIQQTDFKP